MVELSPAAQAVMDAWSKGEGGVYLEGDPERLAAALRAAACQIKSFKLLAIAAELGDQQHKNPMTNQHPLTPPPELVRQWINEPLYLTEEQLGKRINIISMNEVKFFGIIDKVSQHGADQELQACCEWLEDIGPSGVQLWGDDLSAARRPESPKSLKEKALSEIAVAAVEGRVAPELAATILRALEALDD